MVGSRVYVGGLPFGVKERDLEKFFKGFGRIRDILIKNGYGFVEFEDHRDADDAVYELNGKDLMGERVTVEPARGIDRSAARARPSRDRGRRDDYNYRYGPPTRTEYRLIVENLSSRISWQDLKDYMRQAGEVTYADAHKQHRNEGVVEFATHSDMRAAVAKLDGTELSGRRIRLQEGRRSARGRQRSSSSRSRSRSKSRRSSRSRSRSKSRPKSKSKTKSPAKGRSRSRSKAGSRSRSRSMSARPPARNGHRDADQKEKSRSRSKMASPKRNDERRTSKSKSKSKSRSRSRSHSRSRSRSRSRGRSASRDRNKEETR